MDEHERHVAENEACFRAVNDGIVPYDYSVSRPPTTSRAAYCVS